MSGATARMIDAGVTAAEALGWEDVPPEDVTAVYLAMEAARTPTKDRETASPASETMLTLAALVEGLHAQIYGVHSLGDPMASHSALADGGQLHEAAHALVRALPSVITIDEAIRIADEAIEAASPASDPDNRFDFEQWARNAVPQFSPAGKWVRDGGFSYNHNIVEIMWQCWRVAQAAALKDTQQPTRESEGMITDPTGADEASAAVMRKQRETDQQAEGRKPTHAENVQQAVKDAEEWKL